MPLIFLVSHDDITTCKADAIVNAANNSLLGGGGVDGAIHRAAGPRLLDECRQLGGCETGDAKITKGYDLPARYVIHTVGPIWRGGKHGEPELLARCYRRCCEIAYEHEIFSIAFPAISTGAYGFPLRAAARIAIQTVNTHLHGSSSLMHVTFCCFGSESYETYKKVVADVIP